MTALRCNAGLALFAILFIAALAPPSRAETTYHYDKLGRLIRVVNIVSGETVDYAYDAAGNRISASTALPVFPFFSINDATAAEGGDLTFEVRKSGSSSRSHSVSYATSNISATAGSDYASTSGVLTFAPSELLKTIAVSSISDAAHENNETFRITLSAPTNDATIDDPHGEGTIEDNDPAPSFSISNASVSEGGALSFVVSKNGQSNKTHTVAYSTVNGTARAGSDYVAASSTLTFTPSQASRNVAISTIEDSSPEASENFYVDLSAPSNGASIASNQGRGVGTIVNDDNFPPVARNDSLTLREGSGLMALVLSNDTDNDNDPLRITSISVSGAYALSAVISCSNTCITVYGLSHGSGRVRYTVSDGRGGTASATLFVTVTGGGSLN